MLTLSQIRVALPSRQKGVTLLITLIMLVVMTLATIALIRSTDTTNLIAGNVAFQQAATQSAEQGIEAGAAFLGKYKQSPGTLAAGSIPAQGYSASYISGQASPSDWWQWWANAANTVTVQSLPQDAAGNTVSYVVERMCDQSGLVGTSGVGASLVVCEMAPLPSTNNCQDADILNCPQLYNRGDVYYRITAKVQGVKNTQSLVQVLVHQ